MAQLLLVEDDAVLAEALARALTALGHEVNVAPSGELALEQLFDRRTPTDLVLLDVMLPGIDGFEVCRKIRAKSTVPVVLLTARGDPPDCAAPGIHLRRSCADSVVRNSTVTDTGLVQPGCGEGVYIGSAVSNWHCYGTTGGVITGNTFTGQGITGENSADSWAVKGAGYTIYGNHGTFTSPGAFVDGYQTHNVSTTPSFPSGCGNVWRNNVSDLGGGGQYGINVTSVSKCAGAPNVVYASNTATNAVKGLTNIAVTP